MKPLVFVSCGQFTSEEKNLGKEICELIGDLRPDLAPYFAENQSDLNGLSTNILEALNRCSALICVMHERGTIETPSGRLVRGSVWIEQEIAIAAFQTHVNQKTIPVLFYAANSVSREGIRTLLHLNAVRFARAEDVLADLRLKLPDLAVNVRGGLLLVPEVTYEPVSINRDEHKYVLSVLLVNRGTQSAADYEVDLLFPTVFFWNQGAYHRIDMRHSTPTHSFIRIPHIEGGLRPGELFYPGTSRRVLTLEYHVDDKLFRSGDLQSEVSVVVRSGNMAPQRCAKPMSDLSHF